jgi:hypothetical protein
MYGILFTWLGFVNKNTDTYTKVVTDGHGGKIQFSKASCFWKVRNKSLLLEYSISQKNGDCQQYTAQSKTGFHAAQ